MKSETINKILAFIAVIMLCAYILYRMYVRWNLIGPVPLEDLAQWSLVLIFIGALVYLAEHFINYIQLREFNSTKPAKIDKLHKALDSHLICPLCMNIGFTFIQRFFGNIMKPIVCKYCRAEFNYGIITKYLLRIIDGFLLTSVAFLIIYWIHHIVFLRIYSVSFLPFSCFVLLVSICVLLRTVRIFLPLNPHRSTNACSPNGPETK